MNEPKKAEEERQRLLHDLKEQVKELTALHYTARLLQDRDNDPDAVGVDQPAQKCGRLPGASGENHDCGRSDGAAPFGHYYKDHRHWAEIASDLLPKVSTFS